MSQQPNGSSKGCPVDRSKHASEAPHTVPKGCPVSSQQAPSFAQSLLDKEINPLNQMPHLPQSKHTDQTEDLSTDRELSTIPRADSGSRWEYPSPQQFFNALARKNMAAPEQYMDVMVDIHNFLNEGAWQEVLKWESRHKDRCLAPKLVRLQGRPNDLSPLARVSGWLHGARPFDRHDWYVDRCGRQVRYVIDYYEGVPENDMPVFNLVVRPAVDDLGSLTDRAKQLWDDARAKYLSK